MLHNGWDIQYERFFNAIHDKLTVGWTNMGHADTSTFSSRAVVQEPECCSSQSHQAGFGTTERMWAFVY